MSIVATEIESVHGGSGDQKLIYYRCQDSNGQWHNYGPVITTDDSFDKNAFMLTVADKMAEMLAEEEANRVIE